MDPLPKVIDEAPQLRRDAISELFANTHAIQIDERIASAEHTDRNLLNLYESLPKQGTFRPGQPYAMPVESNDRIEDRDVALTSMKGGAA